MEDQFRIKQTIKSLVFSFISLATIYLLHDSMFINKELLTILGLGCFAIFFSFEEISHPVLSFLTNKKILHLGYILFSFVFITFHSRSETVIESSNNISIITESKESRESPEVIAQILEEETIIESYTLGDFVKSVCSAHDVDGDLLISQFEAESNFNNDAVSKRGALGIAQLMPIVYRGVYHINPHDAVENIIAGIRYHKYLKTLFTNDNEENNRKLTLAAYNCGPGRVAEAIRVSKTDNYEKIKHRLPAETQNYVKTVLYKYHSKKQSIALNM